MTEPLSVPCSIIDVCMIVRDEEAIIERSIGALLKAGFSSFVILDMESIDDTVLKAQRLAGQKARVYSYPQASLLKFGYSEARNVCATFSRREWILFVDADEILIQGCQDSRVSYTASPGDIDVLSIRRNNLAPNGGSGSEVPRVNTVEEHNRLYKPSVVRRWGGYIHEEIYAGSPTHSNRGKSDLVFDHYSALKPAALDGTRSGLYAILLLRAYNQPELRAGTNTWWFSSHVPAHLPLLEQRAAEYARQNSLTPVFYGVGPQGAFPHHQSDQPAEISHTHLDDQPAPSSRNLQVRSILSEASEVVASKEAPDEVVRAIRDVVLTKVWNGIDPLSDKSAFAGRVDYQGWASDNPILTRAIREVCPRVVVEVGVWKGGSVMTMAREMRALRLSGVVIAIDTWLGAWDHWIQSNWFASLRMEAGYPTLFKTFAANIIESNLEDYVVPLPLDSLNAAFVLKARSIHPDVLHIDGAHDYNSVFSDLRAWWPLLSIGGALIGDDYHPSGDTWPEVREAFHDFFKTSVIENVDGKCYIRKP